MPLLTPILKNPRFAKIFSRDAQKAVIAIRENLVKEDAKALTSSFHGMKSALGNVGLADYSKLAFDLEQAGKNEDMSFIKANADEFVEILGGYILPDEEESAADVAEDGEFIKKQLGIAKTACDDYDMNTACSAIDSLLDGKPLKFATKSFIEKVRDLLYSDSDFDGASEKIGEYLSK